MDWRATRSVFLPQAKCSQYWLQHDEAKADDDDDDEFLIAFCKYYLLLHAMLGI